MNDTTIHTDHNLARLHDLEGTTVRLEMNIETHAIHTTVVGTLEEVHYRGICAPIVAWTVTTEDGTKVQFADYAVTYAMANTNDILIQVK